MIDSTEITVAVFCDHARVDHGDDSEATHRPCSNQLTLTATMPQPTASFTEALALDTLLEEEARQHGWKVFSLAMSDEAHICPQHSGCSMVADPNALDEALSEEDPEPWRCDCQQPPIPGQEELDLDDEDADLQCTCMPVDPSGNHGHACDLYYEAPERPDRWGEMMSTALVQDLMQAVMKDNKHTRKWVERPGLAQKEDGES